METKKKKLPVGIEMFRDIREHDFTIQIKQALLKNCWSLGRKSTYLPVQDALGKA